ncbi:hypothetical protein BIW11_07423, partial [Tropilaelaps mercedesae]
MQLVRTVIVFAAVLSPFVMQLAVTQCVYEGRSYNSAEQLPSSDACEFCMCYRDSVLCLSQPCPPPAEGCQEVTINGFCCPRYECGTYNIDISTKNFSISSSPTNAISGSTSSDLTNRGRRESTVGGSSTAVGYNLPLPL